MKMLISLLTLFLLGGCVSSGYREPVVDVPEHWRQPVDSVITEAERWPDVDWWRHFDSCELDALIEEALQANNDLLAASERIQLAKALAQVAAGPLFPQISATGVETISKNSTSSLTDFDTTTDSSSSNTFRRTYEARLDASYELDFFGRNRFAYEAAAAGVCASIYDWETVHITLVAQVAITYFAVLQWDDRIRIANENLRNLHEVLRLVKARFRLGAISDVEVSQQETVIALYESTIPPMQLQRETAFNALAVLLGRLPESLCLYSYGMGAIAIPESLPEGIPSELIDRRPDIRKSEYDLIAANADIAVARANFFPLVALTGKDGFRSMALSSLFTPANHFYQLALSATQIIFSGGRLTGTFKATRARYFELLYGYHQVILTAFGDVENALAAVEYSTQQETILNAAVASAQRSFELAMRRFKQGQVDFTVVLDSQRALLIAEDNLAQAHFAKLSAYVALYKALGGGW